MAKLNRILIEHNKSMVFNKWKPAIMVVLLRRPERFNKIRQLLFDINPKTLSKNLREMESDGLVLKTEEAYPVYSLTPLANDIAQHLLSIYEIINQTY